MIRRNNMGHLKYLLRKACERCEEGMFENCESYLNCPVYVLYCEANKKEKIIYKQNSWQMLSTPKSEMI
jgi:hypothetical protein